MRIFAQVTGTTISQGNTKSLVASTLWILCNPACPTENIFSRTAEGLSWYVGGFCSWLRKTREGLGKFGELSLPYFCVIVPYIPSASALPSTLSPSTNKLSFLHKSKKKKKGREKDMAKQPKLLEQWKSGGLTRKSQSRSNSQQNFIAQIWNRQNSMWDQNEDETLRSRTKISFCLRKGKQDSSIHCIFGGQQ